MTSQSPAASFAALSADPAGLQAFILAEFIRNAPEHVLRAALEMLDSDTLDSVQGYSLAIDMDRHLDCIPQSDGHVAQSGDMVA